ncbi:hypothetical protein ASG57_26040 [Bradyrhizobium sp. Leaf396]|nr:hypothetical protein ASG57_26040 [Bradyrhizobium sp. Leaf396]
MSQQLLSRGGNVSHCQYPFARIFDEGVLRFDCEIDVSEQAKAPAVEVVRKKPSVLEAGHVNALPLLALMLVEQGAYSRPR